MDLPTHLIPTSLERAGNGWALSHWFYRAPAGITADHVMDPNIWQHVTNKLKPDDRIEIVARDGSLDMEVRVIAIDPEGHWAQVRPLRVWQDDPMAPAVQVGPVADPEGYVIQRDPVQGYRILRGRDLVAKDFATENDARAALANLKAGRKPVAPKAA